MATIVTLTMNPALDIATSTDRVEPTHKPRCSVPRYDPGGGGINVARAVHALGGDAVAIFPVGGPARVEGSRRCPQDVDIVRFLAEAMRSIASITMKVLSRQPEFQAVPLISDNGLALDPPDWRPTAEQWAISDEETTQIKRVILDLFSDDVTARVMVEGIMEGMDGEDLRQVTDLTKTGFASKRRLIRRRIEKAFRDGWKL